MFAPAALRCRVTASLSSSEIPSTGAGSRAEPPPESRQRHKSSAASDSTSRRISAAPAAPAAVGSFTPAGRAACRRIHFSGPAQSAGTLIQPVSCFSSASLRPEDFFHGGRHAGACLAGADHDDPPQAAQGDLFIADDQQRPFDAQRLADEPIGADGREAGMPDGQGVGEQGGRRKAEGGSGLHLGSIFRGLDCRFTPQ